MGMSKNAYLEVPRALIMETMDVAEVGGTPTQYPVSPSPIAKPRRVSAMDTNNRAIDSNASTSTGQYWQSGKPRFALRISSIMRRSQLVVRSGIFFSTAVVGVASTGAESATMSVEHAKIRRARMSIRNSPEIKTDCSELLALYGGVPPPRVRGTFPTPRT